MASVKLLIDILSIVVHSSLLKKVSRCQMHTYRKVQFFALAFRVDLLIWRLKLTQAINIK